MLILLVKTTYTSCEGVSDIGGFRGVAQSGNAVSLRELGPVPSLFSGGLSPQDVPSVRPTTFHSLHSSAELMPKSRAAGSRPNVLGRCSQPQPC